MASLYCDIPSIILLIESGAYVNAKDAYGNTPLSRVGSVLALDVFRTLVERGADPYLKNNYDVAPADFLTAYPDIIAIFEESKK